jgi:hypothetical protein
VASAACGRRRNQDAIRRAPIAAARNLLPQGERERRDGYGEQGEPDQGGASNASLACRRSPAGERYDRQAELQEDVQIPVTAM